MSNVFLDKATLKHLCNIMRFAIIDELLLPLDSLDLHIILTLLLTYSLMLHGSVYYAGPKL